MKGVAHLGIFIFTLLLILVLFLRGGRCLYSGRNYGESCEEGETCYGNHLTCSVSGICSCSSPEEMTFDPETQSCKVNLGSSCTSTWEVMDCIEGAKCHNGICRCESGFYASSLGGVCLPNKGHNESCLTDLECGSSTHISEGETYHRTMVCVNKLCQCDKRIDIYDPEMGSCVGLVDSQCPAQKVEDVRVCTANAHCELQGSSDKNTCQCQSGYAKTSHGTCGKAFGQPCGPAPLHEPCADVHYICIEGNCTCLYPKHQVYDDRIEECLSLVSGPCTFPKLMQTNFPGFHDILKCVKNAHCVDKGFYSDCECKPGFVQTLQGTCSPAYGEPCEPGDCDPDGITQLFCRNGVCECMDLLQVYEPSIKKCRGLVGSRCTTDEPECVEYSSCVVPNPPLPGKCLCDKYSMETVNRTCDYH